MSTATKSWPKWFSSSIFWWKRNLNTDTHTQGEFHVTPVINSTVDKELGVNSPPKKCGSVPPRQWDYAFCSWDAVSPLSYKSLGQLIQGWEWNLFYDVFNGTHKWQQEKRNYWKPNWIQGKEEAQWMAVVLEEGEMQPRNLGNDSLGRPNISLR